MTYDDAMVLVTEGKVVTCGDLEGDFVAMDVTQIGVVIGLPLLRYRDGISIGKYEPSDNEKNASDWREHMIIPFDYK